MAKLRKMLGDVDSLECIAMMRLIETQSETTLARWALGYVESRILPVYKKKAGGERRLDALVQACQQVVQLHQPGKTGKPWIKEAGQIARETADPVAQAAARALLENTDMGARDIAEKALDIAGDICIYTNHFHTIEELPSKA